MTNINNIRNRQQRKISVQRYPGSCIDSRKMMRKSLFVNEKAWWLSIIILTLLYRSTMTNGYLQGETVQFVQDFPKYSSRAYTAVNTISTPPAICQSLPTSLTDTTTTAKFIVVQASSSSNVVSSSQLQTQCGSSSTCIVENLIVEMDSTIALYALIIRNNGKVHWRDSYQNTQYWLCSGYVAVEMGGSFDMNLQQSMGWIYIVNNGAFHPQLRSRAFGAVGNSTRTDQQPIITIRGREMNRTWSLLAKPLKAGDTDIQLQHSPAAMGWQIGHRIAIASTMDRSQGEAQSFNIVKIDDSTRTITLSKSSTSFHEALTVLSSGNANPSKGITPIFQSAEVINLSRNIVITGDDFVEVSCDPTLTEVFPGFGTSTSGCMCTNNRRTCTMGLHTVHMGGGTTQIQNTRVEKCGQRGVEGKYCLHFHQMRDCPNCLYRNNAIEFSQQRGLIIHGTHNAVADSNVLYDVRGANLYVEDGNELHNTFSNNVAICPWKVSLQGCSLPGTSNTQGDTSLNQAGIYLESPTNHLLGNRMANHFNGMFLNPTGGRGLVQNKVCPHMMPIGRWEGNMYHSSGRFGTYALNGNYPVRNTGSSIASNGLTTICQYYTDNGYDNGLPVTVTNNADYGNAFVGHYGAGDIQYNGHTSFNNLNLIYWKETKAFADGCSAHITKSHFLKGNMALPDSLGSFIIEHTTLTDVQLEANHHCGIGVTGFLCMPQYVLHNVTWQTSVSRSQWVAFTQSNNAGSGGIFSLSPSDALLNIAGTGGNFLPKYYQSLVSSVYPYLVNTGVCDLASTLGFTTRYASGILCKVPLRVMKIYSAGISSGFLLVQVWRTNMTTSAPIAQQTIPFYRSNSYSQGFKFPVIPGKDFFYRVSRAGSADLSIPSNWIIDFGDQTISNRWGVDTLNVDILGRTCGGTIRSDHDRRYIVTDIAQTLKVNGIGWGHGACTSYPPMPLIDCTNVTIPTYGPATTPVHITPSVSTAPIKPNAPVSPPRTLPTSPAVFPIPVPTSVTPPSSVSVGRILFKLISVPTNVAVMNLVNGTIIYQSDFGANAKFNVQAIPTVSTTKSVWFSNGRIEGVVPYAYCGDSNGSYIACPDLIPTSGTITISAATDNELSSRVSVSFQIIAIRPSTKSPTAKPRSRPPTLRPVAALPSYAPIQTNVHTCDNYCRGVYPYGCNPNLKELYNITTYMCNADGGCQYYTKDQSSQQPTPPTGFCIFQTL